MRPREVLLFTIFLTNCLSCAALEGAQCAFPKVEVRKGYKV